MKSQKQGNSTFYAYCFEFSVLKGLSTFHDLLIKISKFISELLLKIIRMGVFKC